MNGALCSLTNFISRMLLFRSASDLDGDLDSMTTMEALL